MFSTSLVAAIASLCGPGVAFGGAWTLNAGTGQVIVTGLYSRAGRGFDDERDPTRSLDFEKATGSFYGEYGLTDIFTLIGAGEFGVEGDGAALADPAISELALGARLRLLEGQGSVVSGQVTALVDDETDTLDRRMLGWDSPAIEGRFLLGRSFDIGSWSAFVDLEAGYRYHPLPAGDGRKPDEVRLDAAFGVRPLEKVQLIVQSFSTVSAREPRAVRGYDYHKLQASIVYDLNARWSVQTGGFATVAGRNALRENGLIAALWYRF